MTELANAWPMFMGGFLLLAKVSGVALTAPAVGAFIYDMWTRKDRDDRRPPLLPAPRDVR